MISESLRIYLNNPRKVRVRSWAFNVHLYAGITVGLILAAITLSGSAIVFRNSIGFALHRIGSATSSAANANPSLQSIIDRIRDQNPGFTIGEIDGFSRTDGLLLIRLRRAGHDGSDRDLFVDSGNGELVLGHPRLTNALENLEDFHKNLLMGRRGRGVNGVVALLFLAIILTAPIVWWPGIGRWARAMKINLSLSWKRVNYDLHSAAGIVCLIFLSIMSVTAVLLATPDVLRLAQSQSTNGTKHNDHHHGPGKGGAGHAISSSHVGEKKHSVGTPDPTGALVPIDLDVSVLRSNTSLAEWKLWSIRLPEGDEPMSAELRQGNSSIEAEVDPRSAGILNVAQPKGWGVSMDAHSFAEALHFGRVGGSFTQALWVLFGLSPALLMLTGYLMWWNRSLSKRFKTL